MPAQSPITPSDLGSISDGLLACDHLKELLNTRVKMHTFLAWLLVDDSTGNLGDGFKLAIIQQLLFDAAKKNWFVRSNPSTGYLELVQYVPLASLDASGALEGDTLVLKGGVWVPQSSPSVYLSPTSGGTTVPDPDTGGILLVAHGLASTPNKVECYLVCTVNDIGYVVGDVVNAMGLVKRGSGGEQRQGVSIGANATSVWAVFTNTGAAVGSYQLPNKSTFAGAAITPGSWNVKLYAAT